MSPTRRSYLEAAGSSVAMLSTPPSVSATATNGQLVFVYDDGPMNDFTQAFPVHRDEDAPACVGACSSFVADPEEGLDREHLLEMQDAGWEIMSHTKDHRALGPVYLTEDVDPGDERIFVEHTLHGEHPGDAIRLVDEQHSEVVTVTGIASDVERGCLTLDSPVEHSYSTENGAKERLSDDVLHEAIVESKAELEAMGLRIDDFVFPYGRYGERTLEIVRDHYVGVANYDWQGLNPGRGVDPYTVGREYFPKEVMTRAEIEEFLDRVVEEDALGMFAGHTWKEDLTRERIQFAIRAATRRDVEIVTLRDAFRSQGVTVDTPTPTDSPTSSRPSPTSSASTPPTNRGTDSSSGGIVGTFSSVIDSVFGWLFRLF